MQQPSGPFCLLPATLVLALVAAACAPRAIVLPSGPGRPFDGFEAAMTEARARCEGVRTWTAEVALAGRAGPTRIRGRVLAGLARPASVRLVGVAPFGAPGFVLVGHGSQATLLLPRDHRVLRGADPADVVEALVGVRLGPDDLRAVLTGCLVSQTEAEHGRVYARGWHAVDLAPEVTAYLRRVDGRWRVEAGVVRGLWLDYGDFFGGMPRRVRLWSTGQDRGAAVNLTVTLSQVDINVALGDEAFAVDVPNDAVPLTLDELRETGPLAAGR